MSRVETSAVPGRPSKLAAGMKGNYAGAVRWSCVKAYKGDLVLKLSWLRWLVDCFRIYSRLKESLLAVFFVILRMSIAPHR